MYADHTAMSYGILLSVLANIYLKYFCIYFTIGNLIRDAHRTTMLCKLYGHRRLPSLAFHVYQRRESSNRVYVIHSLFMLLATRLIPLKFRLNTGLQKDPILLCPSIQDRISFKVMILGFHLTCQSKQHSSDASGSHRI